MQRLFLFILLALFIALPAMAQESEGITPEQLWSAMLKGNEQFVAGKITYDNLKEERTLFSAQQMPPITVLACSDSRVPPELLFNQSLGALFVVRSSGNVSDEFGLASIEYAVANNYTKLIVVLGHENCSAVKASLGGGDPISPALKALATRIRTSFIGIPYDASNADNVKKAVIANTRASAAHLIATSSVIRDAAATNKLKLVTAYYDLDEGTVTKVD